MNQKTSNLGAWVELMRLSNLPTVWSNAVVGAAMGVDAGVLPWRAIAATAASASLLYTGGMVLNDLLDADVDKTERPGRPIPSGRITKASAGSFAGMLFLAGIAVIWTASPLAVLVASLLVGLIVLYNLTHRLSVLSVAFMGLCRGMIYVLGAAVACGAFPVRVVAPAAVLAGYTIMISLMARKEAGDPARMALVSSLLAGICIFDAALLFFRFKQPLLAIIPVVCYLLTRVLHRYVKGT